MTQPVRWQWHIVEDTALIVPCYAFRRLREVGIGGYDVVYQEADSYAFAVLAMSLTKRLLRREWYLVSDSSKRKFRYDLSLKNYF